MRRSCLLSEAGEGSTNVGGVRRIEDFSDLSREIDVCVMSNVHEKRYYSLARLIFVHCIVLMIAETRLLRSN